MIYIPDDTLKYHKMNSHHSIKAFLSVWNAFLKQIFSAGIILAICTLSGCTKEIELDIEAGEVLVLNSIINPDSIMTFYVSFSSSSIEEYREVDDTFHLKLYEEDLLILDTIFNSGILNSDFKPGKNKRYHIEVAAEGITTLFASDSIPSLVPIEDSYLIFPAGTDNFGDPLAEANITFTDPSDEENYYELLIYQGQDNKSYWCSYNDFTFTDPVILNEGDLEYSPNSLFFSDQLFNGKSHTFKVKGYVGFIYNNEGYTPDKTFTVLRSVSKSYYLYRKYYTRHSYNQQFNENNDYLSIIFKGEPQNMFTNITNGYGIFAGYQETTSELYHHE